MKKYKNIQRNYVDKVVDTVTCDICKKEFCNDFWERESYSALDTTVEMRTGSSYPEGGSGENIEFHICPDCFENKLIPFLKKEFDAEPTTTDWETY